MLPNACLSLLVGSSSHPSARSLFGQVALFSPPCLPSNRCGYPRQNTPMLERASFIESVSKRSISDWSLIALILILFIHSPKLLCCVYSISSEYSPPLFASIISTPSGVAGIFSGGRPGHLKAITPPPPRGVRVGRRHPGR